MVPENGDKVTLVEIHEAGSNVIVLFDRKNKYSSIANPPCSGRLDDELYDVMDSVVVGNHIDHRFRQERLAIFHSAIGDGVALLPAKSPHLRHSHAGDDALKFFDNVMKFVRLDNAFDQFHGARTGKNTAHRARMKQTRRAACF